MIPISRLFLISEVVPMWPRLSIGNTAGPAVQTGRPQLTSDQKIKNSEAIQSRLTVRPNPNTLGFKKVPKSA